MKDFIRLTSLKPQIIPRKAKKLRFVNCKEKSFARIPFSQKTECVKTLIFLKFILKLLCEKENHLFKKNTKLLSFPYVSKTDYLRRKQQLLPHQNLSFALLVLTELT